MHNNVSECGKTYNVMLGGDSSYDAAHPEEYDDISAFRVSLFRDRVVISPIDLDTSWPGVATIAVATLCVPEFRYRLKAQLNDVYHHETAFRYSVSGNSVFIEYGQATDSGILLSEGAYRIEYSSYSIDDMGDWVLESSYLDSYVLALALSDDDTRELIKGHHWKRLKESIGLKLKYSPIKTHTSDGWTIVKDIL